MMHYNDDILISRVRGISTLTVASIDHFLLYSFHFISHYDGIFFIGIQFPVCQQSTAFTCFDSQYGKPLIAKFLNGVKRILLYLSTEFSLLKLFYAFQDGEEWL